MGRMAWPCTSFSTTMGMFVTGSIIRPRIFISTSMKASLGSNHVLAHQTVRRCSCHTNLNVGSQKFIRMGSEICQAIRTGISRPLALAPRLSAHQHFVGFSNEPRVARGLDFPLLVLKNCKPPALLFLRNCVIHFQRRRVGPRRVLEREQAVVPYFVEQTQCLFQLSRAFPGSTDHAALGNAA